MGVRRLRAIHLSRLHWCDAVPRLAGRCPVPAFARRVEATRLAWTAPAPDDPGAIRPDEAKSAQMDSPVVALLGTKTPTASAVLSLV